jgi:hypothetical protein
MTRIPPECGDGLVALYPFDEAGVAILCGRNCRPVVNNRNTLDSGRFLFCAGGRL